MFIFHPTQRLGKIPKILALCETGQLRLAPALIWKSGERPALFAGTVAIDTTPAETNGSAPGTPPAVVGQPAPEGQERSEEHTSELQSLMRNTYAGFCLKKNKKQKD